jgi:hypothetical protein
MITPVYVVPEIEVTNQASDRLDSMAPRAIALATVCLVFLGCFAAGEVVANESDTRAERGFAIAEQNGFTLDRENPALGLGSYLVNNSGCNDCHTWPNFAQGGDPFSRQPKQINAANYLAGGRLFALPTENVCSRNITPAPGTNKPAGLSRSDFIHVFRTGCDPQAANFQDAQACELLQVMPWPLYQDMTRQDVGAIYSFLSAIPHQEPGGAAQCVPDPQGVAGE